MIIRIFDIFLSFLLIILFLFPIIIISLIIVITSGYPIIHLSKRVGKNNVIFLMPKFRSMYTNAPLLSTEKFLEHNNYITPFGRFLRKTSLDELPQFFSVIKGDMSIVGPRPALFNQYELISQRNKLNINSIRPGITGLAQINGRDNLDDKNKLLYDEHYLNNISVLLYLKIIYGTFFAVVYKKNINF